MKLSVKSIAAWGFLAMFCVLLLCFRSSAAEGAGPGDGLPEYSSGNGGIIYQGDPRNGARTADAALTGTGVITDDPEVVKAAEEAAAADAKAQSEGVSDGTTEHVGEVYVHDGVSYKKGAKLGNFRLSGYDGSRGDMTYSGKRARTGHTVAADQTMLPIGTVIIIEGTEGDTVHSYDGVYVVEDIGSAVRGTHLDIYCGDTAAAKAVTDSGWQYSDVYIALPAGE